MSAMPHIGVVKGRCNFCGVRIDNSTRGQTCEKATKELSR